MTELISRKLEAVPIKQDKIPHLAITLIILRNDYRNSNDYGLELKNIRTGKRERFILNGLI